MSDETSLSRELYNAFLQLDNENPEVANAAYKKIYHGIYRAAYNHCNKIYMVTDAMIIEEIVLQSLMLVKTKFHQLREPAAFVGFVNGKIWHATRTIARKFDLKKMATEPNEELLAVMESQNPSADPVMYSETSEQADIVQDALDRLPDERMGRILRLRYNEGIRFREIAELLGISENNAKVLCNRAKKKLCEDKILAKYFKDHYSTKK